jgi:fatty-acyl-CoA synthase/long-chain acyl-CoA synthetase
VVGDPSEPDFAALHGDAPFTPAEVDPEAPGLILYTGGTTGRSKGVVHGYGALGINLLAHAIWGEIAPDEHLLIVSPLPHSAGFHVQAALMQGARVTLHSRFDAGDVIRSIASERITWTFLVPTMISRLLDHPDLPASDLHSLRTLLYGAAPITAARLEQGLAALGPIFLQLYGQSECPNFATTLSKADHLRPELLGSCGQAVPAVRVSVRDDAGTPVANGTIGEVCLHSSYTLRGYHGDAEQSARAFHAGRWLRTGDLGYLVDSGHLFLVDRAKDMVISGGMNVYSAEVEHAILEIAGVREVAVVGLPHADWGEAVTACVVRDGPAPESDAVLAHCRARLSRYKVPKRIEFVASLPLTAYGKVDKKSLRAALTPPLED